MKKYIAPPIDSETLAELKKFIAAEGRNWKSKLNNHWMRASAPGLLHRLRNTHGPEWLASYKLPEDAENIRAHREYMAHCDDR